jgi:hypothetical protein
MQAFFRLIDQFFSSCQILFLNIKRDTEAQKKKGSSCELKPFRKALINNILGTL